MSIVSGTLSAINQKKSASQANRTNRQIADQTNAQNFYLDVARRGAALPNQIGKIQVPSDVAGKSSAILPYYLNDSEMAAQKYAADTFNTLSADSGTNSIGALRASSEKYRQAMDRGGQDVNGIFNGAVTDEELAAAQPVAAARIKLAGARKDASLQALEDKINDIRAIQGRKGYTGDSLGSSRIRFDATRKILGDAAIDQSTAELQNSIDSANINRGGIQRRLASVNLPIEQATREGQFADLPNSILRQNAENNISIFNPFRVNGGFQTIRKPDSVEPLPSTLGIISGQMAGTAQDVGSYLARRDWRGQPVGYGPQNTPAYSNPDFGGSVNYGGGAGYYDAGSASSYGGASDFGGSNNYGGGQGYSFDFESGVGS